MIARVMGVTPAGGVHDDSWHLAFDDAAQVALEITAADAACIGESIKAEAPCKVKEEELECFSYPFGSKSRPAKAWLRFTACRAR